MKKTNIYSKLALGLLSFFIVAQVLAIVLWVFKEFPGDFSFASIEKAYLTDNALQFVVNILGFGITATAYIMNRQRKQYEKFAPVYSLTYGYFLNFLRPFMDSYREKNENNVLPKVYIYLPDLLSDLQKSHIDGKKTAIGKIYTTDEANIVSRYVSRGMVFVYKVLNKDNKEIFVDFPSTLFALTYDTDDLKDDLVERASKEKLLIGKFEEYLNKFIKNYYGDNALSQVDFLTNADFKNIKSHLKFPS